jgi:hypothetical protein
LALAFGDYIELPLKTTNEIDVRRTRPAIALLGTGNAYNTWIYFTLDTGRIVFIKMQHNELTIRALNEFAKDAHTPHDVKFHLESLENETVDIDDDDFRPMSELPRDTYQREIVVTDNAAEETRPASESPSASSVPSADQSDSRLDEANIKEELLPEAIEYDPMLDNTHRKTLMMTKKHLPQTVPNPGVARDVSQPTT